VAIVGAGAGRAEALSPASPTLPSLQALLAARGLAGISYDL
jgi:hypothetical protein